MTSATADMSVRLTSTAVDTEALGTATSVATLGFSQRMASGGTTSTVDSQVQAGYTIPASSSTTIDLKDLTDSLGNTVAFDNIKALVIHNTGYTTSAKTTASAADIVVGGVTSPADTFAGFFGDSTDTVKVFNKQILPLLSTIAGVEVGASTNLLLITNSSATAAIYVEVLIVGEKA